VNDTERTASEWAAAHRAKLDQVAAAHAAQVLPLAERHNIPVESCALIVLSIAVELVDADDQLAAITRAVVATVEGHQRKAADR
jgi:hypothetical protein